MHRYKFHTTYLGPSFAGWARSNDPNAPGVCNALDSAFRRVADDLPITVVGAGRTDAGVHGLSQRVHVDLIRQKRLTTQGHSHHNPSFKSTMIKDQHIKQTLSSSLSLVDSLKEFYKVSGGVIPPTASHDASKTDSQHASLLHDVDTLVETISTRYPIKTLEQSQSLPMDHDDRQRHRSTTHGYNQHNRKINNTSTSDNLPPVMQLPPTPLISAYTALYNIKPNAVGKYTEPDSFVTLALHPDLYNILHIEQQPQSIAERKDALLQAAHRRRMAKRKEDELVNTESIVADLNSTHTHSSFIQSSSRSCTDGEMVADPQHTTPVNLPLERNNQSLHHQLNTISTVYAPHGVNIPYILPALPPTELNHIINHQLRNKNTLYDSTAVSITDLSCTSHHTYVYTATDLHSAKMKQVNSSHQGDRETTADSTTPSNYRPHEGITPDNPLESLAGLSRVFDVHHPYLVDGEQKTIQPLSKVEAEKLYQRLNTDSAIPPDLTLSASKSNDSTHGNSSLSKKSFISYPFLGNTNSAEEYIDSILPTLLSDGDLKYYPNHYTLLHSRYDAYRRQYQYRVILSPDRDPFEENHAWQLAPSPQRTFSIHHAQQAANILTGYHDYNSFRSAHCQAPSSERRVDDISLSFQMSFQKQQQSLQQTRSSHYHHLTPSWSSNPLKHTPSFIESCRTSLFDILPRVNETGGLDDADLTFIHRFLELTGGTKNVHPDIHNIPFDAYLPYNPEQHGNILTLGFTARSYLYSQVRILTAAIIAAGMGEYTPEQIEEFLHVKDRKKNTISTAPAHGLFLTNVYYPSNDTQLAVWRKICHLQRKVHYLNEM